jgi:6-pyruvoyltetrahydropterin/6-carboxytetrahydropterin synthase
MKTTLQTEFSCAHRYVKADWTKAKNQKTFGKCFYEHGHGHDYRLEVTFQGATGQMKKSLQALRRQLDHRHLNFDIKEFSRLVPTTENLGLFCLEFLQKKARGANIDKVTLYEKSDLWVEIRPA